MTRKGNGYLSTNKIETSTSANFEVIPAPNPEWRWTNGFSLYKFSFLNRDQCVVVLNGKTEVYLEAGQGFEMTETDSPITSFIIKNSGVNYTFIGAY